LERLFTILTHAVDGAPLLALSASLAWGVLSILLSPCHLASIPLIVGFIEGQGRTTVGRAFWISLLFASGILATIAAIGGITAAAGRMMGDLGGCGNYFVALVFFGVGLHLLGVLRNPFGKNLDQVKMERKGLAAAFLLGLVFGIALGPCSFAFMAPMLGICFKLGAEQPLYAGSLLLMYGVGHCAVIVLAGTSASLVQRYMDWNEKSHGALLLKRACGILVLLGGLYLVYTAS